VLVKIANIFVAPTLTTDKFEVRKGDPIAFLGQSTPKSEITLEVNSEEQIFVKTVVDDAGVYLHNFDTSVLEKGQHHVQSRSAFAAMVSSQGQAVPFVVGDKNIPSEVTPSCPTKADLNSDCKVNLVDFSVAAFWFNRQLSESFLLREKEKLNGDGKISIVDFSLIAFYWTG
jgi:hypothetical protein